MHRKLFCQYGSEYSRSTLPQLEIGYNKELLEKLLREKEKENKMKERIRSLKK